MSQDEVIESITIRLRRNGTLEVRAPRDLLLSLGMLEAAKVQVTVENRNARNLITMPISLQEKGAQ